MLSNKYLAAVVGILLIIVIAYNVKFFYSKSSSSQIPVKKNEKHVESRLTGAIKIPERILAQQDKRQWEQDPFGPLMLSGKADSEGIQLMGIIKRDGRSYALINGKVYSVNERVGDTVIKEIKKHSVVLLAGGKRHEISLEDYAADNVKSYMKEKTE